VEEGENRMVFAPENPVAGLIFYPGGKVEFTAYAPLMAKLAEQNILCVLLKMPLNLAVLDMDAAAEIPEGFPEVETWYLAGHSLGGSMAASFADKHADGYDGLILLASYSTADLTENGLRVCSLYGDRDGVLNMEKYAQYRSNLPEGTLELVLEGGNHAGFGSYGPQEGDGISTLEAGMQIRWAADRILEFILEE
jgi:pimeloyl-ACP methyl ester carboxylesterase